MEVHRGMDECKVRESGPTALVVASSEPDSVNTESFDSSYSVHTKCLVKCQRALGILEIFVVIC